MHDAELHRYAVYALLALGPLTTAVLLFINAPYGRHDRAGFGPAVPQRAGWIVMELPAVALWAALYFLGRHALEPAPLALLALWQLHYLQRVFVYPFRMRAAGKTMPLAIVLGAILFNTLNAYANARWVSEHGSYPAAWLADPRFLAGGALFLAGFALNVWSDGILVGLRKPGERGYAIPRGGPFRLVSCPNYLGEIVAWAGWAIATWSLPGLAFALYVVANLLPRALAHHRWYRERFPDYPAERRALLPFLL